MKTLLLCFFALGVRLVSSNNTTTESACGEHTVFCQYLGQSWPTNYTFRMDDLQDALCRCQIVVFGQFYFDRKNTVNTHVLESDKNALRSLIEYGKTVYMVIGFQTRGGWAQVLDPQDEVLYNYHVTSLVTFIKEYKISGVILEYTLDVFNQEYSYTIDGVTSFVTSIRSGVESLKIGLTVNGVQYQSFSDSQIFDISCMNTVLDYFVIDMTFLNWCDAETRCGSINPVQSQNNTLITIEKVSVAVKDSPMDKCKVIAMLLVSIAESVEDIIANNDLDVFGTYSELCIAATNGNDMAKRLCFASTSVLYNQGKFVRDYFPSILINVLEGDDTSCVCGCRPFVATNSILDGWECDVPQPCTELDNLLS